MEKIFWFVLLVVIGVGSLLVLSNQNVKNTKISDILLSPTPHDILHDPMNQAQKQQPQQQTQPKPIPTPDIFTVESSQAAQEKIFPTVIIKTSKGAITLTLDKEKAPNTVQNFLTKAKSGYYNNLIFHRVEDWVVQGGDPKGNGRGGGIMQTELNDKPFVTGSLGVAHGSDIRISNDSQFFITKSEASWLDRQYTNFGIVKDGVDVVQNLKIGDKILGISTGE